MRRRRRFWNNRSEVTRRMIKIAHAARPFQILTIKSFSYDSVRFVETGTRPSPEAGLMSNSPEPNIDGKSKRVVTTQLVLCGLPIPQVADQYAGICGSDAALLRQGLLSIKFPGLLL